MNKHGLVRLDARTAHLSLIRRGDDDDYGIYEVKVSINTNAIKEDVREQTFTFLFLTDSHYSHTTDTTHTQH